MCDRHDIGLAMHGVVAQAVNRPATDIEASPTGEAKDPTIFIYDNYPGGIGFSEPLFGLQGPLLTHTRGLIEECACEAGCPACVGPVGQTGPLAKTVALTLLTEAGVSTPDISVFDQAHSGECVDVDRDGATVSSSKNALGR